MEDCAPRAELRRRVKTPRLLGHLSALGLVASVSLASVFARDMLALPDVVILHLAAIMVTAFLFGRGPALLSSTLSVASYNFFFIPPFYTLHVADARDLLTFTMMFAIGLLISGLTARIRRQEAEARAREQRTAALYAF